MAKSTLFVTRMSPKIKKALFEFTAFRNFHCGPISFSQYPSYFVPPVFKKEQQEELEESGEIKKLAHVPVKAAATDSTCSVFHDDLVRTFIKRAMKGGDKELSRTLIEQTFTRIKRMQLEQYHKMPPEKQATATITSPVDMFATAIANCKPVLEITPIKRGGVKYQVPVPVKESRSQLLAFMWLLEAARDKERTVHLPQQLAKEIMNAAVNQGRVVKRKQDLHRQCEANRAYAHYRWS